MKINVLIVDDDRNTLKSLGHALEEDGCRVHLAESGEAAVEVLRRDAVDVVLTDVMMGRVSGMDLLEYVRKRSPETAVILVTGYATVEQAVEAMKRGAFDYLTKPVDLDRLNLLVERALQTRRLGEENRRLRQQLRQRFSVSGIIGQSPALQNVLRRVERVADTDATVLLRGESGTGKDLIGTLIHYHSPRAEGPLIRVNCAALAEGVIESELFGHERGAFTGALRRHRGRFEQAHGGTLFLDEVGDLTPATQVKLLRVIQEGEFERVGGSETLHVSVRLIAATHRSLETLIEEGKFREDLYYRLRVVAIEIPPLRERPEDISLLAEHFLQTFNQSHGKSVELSSKALRCLSRYSWPGNVRELRNCVESLVVMSRRKVVEPEDLPPLIQCASGPEDMRIAVGLPLREIEREAILKTLQFSGGNKSKAAEILGIGLKTLYRRLEEYGLT